MDRYWQQLAIENSVSINFRSTFVDSINVFDYEGHPINRGNFLIMQELVQLKHRKCNHKVA